MIELGGGSGRGFCQARARLEEPDAEPAEAIAFPPRRAIILGASNVIRAIATVVTTAQRAWGTPLDLLLACGHGRAYGINSWVLGRSLPAILRCGIWEALHRRPQAETAVLLTDVGNDLLYGASVEQTAGWLETCLDRLRPQASRVVLTGIPLASVLRLPRYRYLIARTLLFPRSRLMYENAMLHVQQLNERLVELSKQYDVAFVEPSITWYGVDPIHVAVKYWRSSWASILQPWSEEPIEETTEDRWRLWWQLYRLRPQERAIFGWQQQQAQPCAKLPDGSLISMF